MNQGSLTTVIILVLFLYNVTQAITNFQKNQKLEHANEILDFFTCQLDSVLGENHKLRMQVYDLKDSIFTLKYGKEE